MFWRQDAGAGGERILLGQYNENARVMYATGIGGGL